MKALSRIVILWGLLEALNQYSKHAKFLDPDACPQCLLGPDSTCDNWNGQCGNGLMCQFRGPMACSGKCIWKHSYYVRTEGQKCGDWDGKCDSGLNCMYDTCSALALPLYGSVMHLAGQCVTDDAFHSQRDGQICSDLAGMCARGLECQTGRFSWCPSTCVVSSKPTEASDDDPLSFTEVVAHHHNYDGHTHDPMTVEAIPIASSHSDDEAVCFSGLGQIGSEAAAPNENEFLEDSEPQGQKFVSEEEVTMILDDGEGGGIIFDIVEPSEDKIVESYEGFPSFPEEVLLAEELLEELVLEENNVNSDDIITTIEGVEEMILSDITDDMNQETVAIGFDMSGNTSGGVWGESAPTNVTRTESQFEEIFDRTNDIITDSIPSSDDQTTVFERDIFIDEDSGEVIEIDFAGGGDISEP